MSAHQLHHRHLPRGLRSHSVSTAGRHDNSHWQRERDAGGAADVTVSHVSRSASTTNFADSQLSVLLYSLRKLSFY